MADNGALERHKEQIAKLKQELETLDDSLPADEMTSKLTLIGGQLQGIATNATNTASDLRVNLENEFARTADSLENNIDKTNQKLKSMKAQFDDKIDKTSRAVTIENFAKMAGSIASVGTAIQQLQNLGSIWENKDLTTGQRLLQIITNLAISLPMLTTGLTKAMTAMKLMEVTTYKNSAAAAAAITENSAHAVSLGAVGVAASKAGLQIQFLRTTLSFNPFTLLIAGAVAAVAAIGAFINASDEANKKLIESKQAEIDAENKKQEEIENNKQLLTSLEDLNKKYEDGEITRSDLKSTIQDLIDQYGLEGKAADNLAHSYGNLADYIKQAREEAAKEAKESADRELAAARDEVNATAKGTAFDAGSQSGDDYILNIGAGAVGAHGLFADEPKQIEQLLKDAGAVPDLSGDGADFTFLTDFDTEHIVELYNTIQGIVDQVNDLREAGELTDQQLQNSEYYQNMLAWLDQMRDSVESY